MLQEEIEKLMERNQERAILARRPYPPVDLPKVTSQLGGLPILPTQDSWPRASDGTPLHFLARIDCSELPAVRGLIPERGILQFFAQLDEDLYWDGDPSNYARVLYADDGIGTEVAPPNDLPPIGYGLYEYDDEMRLPDEPESHFYPPWPLIFESIRSWSRDPEIDPASGITLKDYLAAVDRARAAETVRTTGWPTNPRYSPNWGGYTFDQEGRRIPVFPDRDHRANKDFPQAWFLAERVARALACPAAQKIDRLERRVAKLDADDNRLLADLKVISGQARSWMQRAQSAGLDVPMSEPETAEFREWLTVLAVDDQFNRAHRLADALRRGVSYAVKYCANSPQAAALMPQMYMARLEGEHAFTREAVAQEGASRRAIKATHHQLLGHAPTSQDIGERSAQDILLLRLVSDRGFGFMFGDCGEIQFWIDEDSLIARRFEAVRANFQGG